MKHVEEAGCSALELTADTPILGRRERDVRNSFGLPEGLWTPNLTADAGSPVPHPGSDSPFKAAIDALFYPDLTWDDVAWLTSITKLPVLVKGLLRADDAVRAVMLGLRAWLCRTMVVSARHRAGGHRRLGSDRGCGL